MSSPRAPDWVRRSAEQSPDQIAVATSDREVTYGELDALVDERAARLARGGIDEHTRLGVVTSAPDLASITSLWAAWRVGAAVLPLPPDRPVGPAGAVGVDAVLDAGGLSRPGVGPRLSAPAPPHTLVLTSGSTGLPRVAVLTATNIDAAVAASRSRLGTGPDDRWLLVLPLHHVGGLSVMWRSAEAAGTVIAPGGFDVRQSVELFGSGTTTMASLVPTMLSRILAASQGRRPTGVRAVLVGGAPAGEALVRRGLAAGIPVLATYGMTEACSQIATPAPDEAVAAAGTTGPPLDGIELSIVSDDGRLVGPGQLGEIVVDGPQISPGYLGEPPRTSPHATGDLGHLDESGRLVVAGRRDEMIITGGENVQPAAVEEILTASPAVAEAAVVGLHDDEWGQIVAAYVVPAGATLDVAELSAHAASRLQGPAVPRRWRVVDELPRLANGKLDREALRDAPAGKTAGQVTPPSAAG